MSAEQSNPDPKASNTDEAETVVNLVQNYLCADTATEKDRIRLILANYPNELQEALDLEKAELALEQQALAYNSLRDEVLAFDQSKPKSDELAISDQQKDMLRALSLEHPETHGAANISSMPNAPEDKSPHPNGKSSWPAHQWALAACFLLMATIGLWEFQNSDPTKKNSPFSLGSKLRIVSPIGLSQEAALFSWKGGPPLTATGVDVISVTYWSSEDRTDENVIYKNTFYHQKSNFISSQDPSPSKTVSLPYKLPRIVQEQWKFMHWKIERLDGERQIVSQASAEAWREKK